VPLPVAGRLQRIDGEHLIPCRDQRRHPRAAVSLDPGQHPGLIKAGITEPGGDHRVQTGHARHSLGQLRPGQHLASRIHPLHIVVVLGPVIADKQSQPISRARAPVSPAAVRENHQRPNEAVLTPRHRAGHNIPSAISSPGYQQGHGLSSGPELVNLYETSVAGLYRVVASVSWGGLIQELAGICGGSGGRLTNRSGCAA
jgi:hypothetical protein